VEECQKTILATALSPRNTTDIGDTGEIQGRYRGDTGLFKSTPKPRINEDNHT
jgi:hypothetical protein